MALKDAQWLYKEYPKTCGPKDFWGQVKRTVKGVAVSQEQIDMIVSSICKGLEFEKCDNLLDLGCGNGALSLTLFSRCGSVLGVDHSAYLISVAKTNFERAPHFTFLERDIVSYIIKEKAPCRFTKALCYGAFSYLSSQNAREVLSKLHKRFINVSTIFLGNIPDKHRIKNFYEQESDYSNLVDDFTSPIGKWWSMEEIKVLGSETGWDVEIRILPAEFYSAHYRYDAILRRRH